VVVTTGAISCAKLQSNYHHQQTNHPVFFLQTGCPSCRLTNSVKALKGIYHIPWTCLPQAHLGVFQLCTGYSKENLKIHTGVPFPPFLPSLTLPGRGGKEGREASPSSPPSPPSPPFLYPPFLRSRAP